MKKKLFSQDWRSPSSSSDEDDNEKKRRQKQKKIKQKLSNFFKLRDKQKKDEKTVTDEFCSQKPSEFPADKVQKDPLEIISPSKHVSYTQKTKNTNVEFVSENDLCLSEQTVSVQSMLRVTDEHKI